MLAIIPLILIALAIQTQYIALTGYATIDCSDNDGDFYYSESCPSAITSCATENLLVTSSSNKRDLEVYENQIVYKDDINGNWDIFHYDISTGVTKQLSTSLRTDSSPKFYGNYVVWQSLEHGNWDIFMYDLSLDTLTEVANLSTNEILPDIYGTTIVWAAISRYGDWDIQKKDISTGITSRLIAKPNNQSSPRIHSDYLVYTEGISPNLNIYLYKISTATTTQITSSGRNNAPEISDSYIVWQSDDTSTWNVYAYNLATGITTTVSADTSYNERLPKIYSDKVVWMDDRNAVFDIFHYDLTTATTTQVTQASSNQDLPAIWDDAIYWSDDLTGYDDIYTGEISSSCTYLSGDCDDSNSVINPGATELCGDLLDNDCDGNIDEGCDTTTTNTTTCLVEGTDYNIWTDLAWSYVLNDAGDSESVSLLSYGDVSCDPSTIVFYIFSTYYDETYGTYTTDYLYDTLEGTLQIYSDDGISLIYADWTTVWPGEDTYFYYILATEDEAVLGDTLYLCESSDCTSESITISDAEDYLAALGPNATTVIEDEEEYIADDEEIDCGSQWDCSNVEWSDCIEGYSSRDLYECTTTPTDDECWADEFVPSYEVECYEDSSNDEEIIDEIMDTTEEVPIFSWLNLLVVSLILISYYFYRERSN